MSGSTIVFYLLALFTLVSGVLAVTTMYIFRAAIFLLFALIGIAGIYFWMDYDFIAAVQIVVYVGGIIVLIIFSIFLTQQAGEKMNAQKWGRRLFTTLSVFCGFALSLWLIANNTFTSTTQLHIQPNVTNIGLQILSTGNQGYALPFELVSILLLAALIGCIIIALSNKPETK